MLSVLRLICFPSWSLDGIGPLSAWSPDGCEGTYQSDILESARLVIPGAAYYVWDCVFVAVETISDGCLPILSSQLLWRDYCVCKVTSCLTFPLSISQVPFFKVCVCMCCLFRSPFYWSHKKIISRVSFWCKSTSICYLASCLADRNWN